MTDADRPVTRRELREELEYLFARSFEVFATKEDLKAFARKEDLKAFATKEDLKAFATKEDLKASATKADLKAFATKADLKAFATKADLKAFPTREEMNKRFDDLRVHFNVVAEDFKSQFGDLHDWVKANTNSLATRVETIETGHGARLLSLENRATALEADRKPGTP